VRRGAVNASSDEVEITVHGRAGHGGYPHRTRDPVLALAQIVVTAQQVVSRRTNPLEAGVVTIGELRAGTAPNVVPGSAAARGTVRALDADRDAMLDALREVAEHTAAAHGCTADFTVVPNEPAVVNDDALAAAVAAALGGRRREDRAGTPAAPSAAELPSAPVLDTTFRSCGADDFSHYGAVLPSLMLFVGTTEAGAEPGTGPGLHHPAFSPDDEMVGEVARALLAAVLAAGRALAAGAPPALADPAPALASPE
jgi:amidohydrolase